MPRSRRNTPARPTLTPAQRFVERVETALVMAQNAIDGGSSDIALAKYWLKDIPAPQDIRIPELRAKVQRFYDLFAQDEIDRKAKMDAAKADYEEKIAAQTARMNGDLASAQAAFVRAQGADDLKGMIVSLRDAISAACGLRDKTVNDSLNSLWDSTVRRCLHGLPADAKIGYSRKSGGHLAILDSAAGFNDAGVLIGIHGIAAAWICVDGDGSTPDSAHDMVARAVAAATQAGVALVDSVPASVAASRAIRRGLG